MDRLANVCVNTDLRFEDPNTIASFKQAIANAPDRVEIVIVVRIIHRDAVEEVPARRKSFGQQDVPHPLRARPIAIPFVVHRRVTVIDLEELLAFESHEIFDLDGPAIVRVIDVREHQLPGALALLEHRVHVVLHHLANAAAATGRLRGWLSAHRDEVFLATKTGERDGAAARAELERSLVRMGVDRVDMIQLHNLVEPDEWDVAFAPGGAVEGLAAARDEGLVDHVGVTGHGLRIAGMHLRSLADAPFASVLFPWNHSLAATYPDYVADVAMLRELCSNQGVAMQTIKSLARRRWADDAGPRFSWYEPIDDADARRRAIEFVLADPDLFLNTSSDARLLAETLEVAASPRTVPGDDQLDADRMTAGITPIFDGAELEVI